MDLVVRGAQAYAASGHKPIDPEKQTVVFVHGVGQDHTTWVLPIRYFARHNRNVLGLDLPGHGRTPGPGLETIEEMGDWVVEALDAAGVEKAALVGHSMGSLVALDTASRYPERVRSLAMVGVYGESQWLTDKTTLRVAADGLSEPRVVKNSARSKIAI